MKVYYMAHPVAPFNGTTVPENLARAKRWLQWLATTFPEIAFIAPWITACENGDDANPAARAKGLAEDCEIVSRCDGLVLVGNRISSGMDQERGSAKHVIDFTTFGYVESLAVEEGAVRWLAARLGVGVAFD